MFSRRPRSRRNLLIEIVILLRKIPAPPPPLQIFAHAGHTRGHDLMRFVHCWYLQEPPTIQWQHRQLSGDCEARHLHSPNRFHLDSLFVSVHFPNVPAATILLINLISFNQSDTSIMHIQQTTSSEAGIRSTKWASSHFSWIFLEWKILCLCWRLILQLCLNLSPGCCLFSC